MGHGGRDVRAYVLCAVLPMATRAVQGRLPCVAVVARWHCSTKNQEPRAFLSTYQYAILTRMQNTTQPPERSLALHIFVKSGRWCSFFVCPFAWKSLHSQLLYSIHVFNASKSVTSLISERCSSGPGLTLRKIPGLEL